jgi:hypothetical protein
MLTKTLIGAGFAALVALASAAQAIEPFRPYDRFDTPVLDPARWAEGERIRLIKGNALHLMQRTWGLAGSDAGITSVNHNSNLANPATVTALKARIKVNALEANACAANVSAGQSRARIVGSFFNVAIPPVPGSQVGDVIVQVRLTRVSNSPDPAGVLRVQGIASICQSGDCALTATIGNIVDLGTVAVGTPTVVQYQWDQGGKTFSFSRDGGAWAGTVAYALPDTTPPMLPFQQLSTRMDLPNCQSAPRVSGLVDAVFDNVAVNRSAAP